MTRDILVVAKGAAMTDINEIVGSNLKRIRKQRGIKQDVIANYLGLDQTTISKIESGKRSIGVASLEKLCDLFFCTLEDFLNEDETQSCQTALAYRAGNLDARDVEGLAAIGRITRNLEEMVVLKEAAHD